MMIDSFSNSSDHPHCSFFLFVFLILSVVTFHRIDCNLLSSSTLLLLLLSSSSSSIFIYIYILVFGFQSNRRLSSSFRKCQQQIGVYSKYPKLHSTNIRLLISIMESVIVIQQQQQRRKQQKQQQQDTIINIKSICFIMRNRSTETTFSSRESILTESTLLVTKKRNSVRFYYSSLMWYLSFSRLGNLVLLI